MLGGILGKRGSLLLLAAACFAALSVALCGSWQAAPSHGVSLRSISSTLQAVESSGQCLVPSLTSARSASSFCPHQRLSPSILSLRGGMGRHSRRSQKNEDVMEEDDYESDSHSHSHDEDDEDDEASEEPRQHRHSSSKSSKSSSRPRHSHSHRHDESEEEETESVSSSEASESDDESEPPSRHASSKSGRSSSRSGSKHRGHDHAMDESESDSDEDGSSDSSHDEAAHDKDHDTRHTHDEKEDESDEDSSSSSSSSSSSKESDDSMSHSHSYSSDEEGESDEDMSDEDDRLDNSQLKRLTAGGESRELTTVGGEGRDLAETHAGDSFIIQKSGHSSSLLQGIEFLRRRHAEHGKSFCDITLEAGGVQAHAHKVVLAAMSPELETLVLSAPKTGILKLEGVDSRGLHGAMSFIYNGTVHVTPSELPSLLKASDVLTLRPLKEACIERLLADLEPSNALKMRALGASLPCIELAEAAHNLVMEEFPTVAVFNEFLELPQDQLEQVIGSEDLLVSSEVEVLDAVLRWVGHDATARTPSLLKLLSHVRLGLMPIDTLAKKVAAEPLIQKTLANEPAWQSMLNAALAFVGSPPDQRTRLSGPQTRPRLGSKGRYIFCVGGRKGANSKAQKRVWMLDKLTYDWFEVEPMLHARKQLAAAELDGKVYAAGGWDGSQYLRSVERFSPIDDRWERVALMALARGSFGLVPLADTLVAAGGFDGLSHLNSVEVYNASKNLWTPAPSLAVCRSGLKLAEVGGTLYAIGGFDGNAVLNTVEKLLPGATSWTPCAPMLEARRDMAVTVEGGKIYVSGGFNGAKDLASVERYDPATDTWTALKPMKIPRSGHGIASIKGKLHAIGGYDGVRYLSQSEAYQGETWEESLEASLPVRMAHFSLTVV